MLHKLIQFIQENSKQAAATKFKGNAALEDCIANKLIKGDAIDELNMLLKIGDIDITNQNELQKYCQTAITLGLNLLFDKSGNVQDWLQECLIKLGLEQQDKFSPVSKKALLEAYLFQAVEMLMVKYYSGRKDIYELRTNGRKTYKTIMGSADRKSGTKLNPRIDFDAIRNKYYKPLVEAESNEPQESIEQNAPEFFDNIFPILVNDNIGKVPGNLEKDKYGLKALLSNSLLQGRAFEYILSRNNIVNIDITDSMELEEFVHENISLGLELFFTEEGQCHRWFNRLLTNLGFRSDEAMSEQEKRIILDAFTLQAVEQGIIRIYSKHNIDDFFVHKMHARQMRKEMLGIADKRTKVLENPDISFDTILDEFTGSQF